jgi:hypothetical protein
MPLTVNVGLSRKNSANYQSAGVSINLTAELDQSLLADPPRLQSEIDRIYSQAETALDRRAAEAAATRAPMTAMTTMTGVGESVPPGGTPSAPSGAAVKGGENHTNGSPKGGNRNAGNGAHRGALRPATESQLKALKSICGRNSLDLVSEAHEEFGVAVNDLDVRQASQLIDALKERLGISTTEPGRRWR